MNIVRTLLFVQSVTLTISYTLKGVITIKSSNVKAFSLLICFFVITTFIYPTRSIEVKDFTMEIPKGVRIGFSGDPSNSFAISWQTLSNNTDSMVYYGKSPSMLTDMKLGSTRMTVTGVTHDVNIVGLSSSTTYFYKCGGGSGNSSIFNFTTAPDSKSGIHFVAYGDTRSNYTRRRLVRNMILQNGSDEFNTEPEFAMNSGDVVADGEIQSLFDNYSVDMEPLASHIPIMHVAGNHDDGVDSVYDVHFIEPSNDNGGWYYSFNWGSAHFVAMNTETDLADGYLDESFLNWLENDLKSARDDENTLWIIGWFHRPLYVSFSHLPETLLRTEWNGLFTEYGVDLLFAGHCHAYQRNYPIKQLGINGIVTEYGDPNYYDPPPIHIVSGAGAVHSEGTTQDDLSNDTYHAKWGNGDYAFFPSNHFCNVNITLDEKTMTTSLQMNVIGLNWTLPNITEDNFSTHVVDRISITKNIPEGYFNSDDGGIDNLIIIVILIVAISVAGVTAVVLIKSIKKKREVIDEEGVLN